MGLELFPEGPQVLAQGKLCLAGGGEAQLDRGAQGGERDLLEADGLGQAFPERLAVGGLDFQREGSDK